MERMRGMRLGALISAALLCAITSFSPAGAGSDDATTTAVKRYFLAEANARCQLLDGATAMAVTSGYVQARNALIRSTGGMQSLTPYLGQARAAAQSVACDAPQLLNEAAAAANAYRAFATQTRLSLPGAHAEWIGTRAHGTEPGWRLAQYQSNADADLALGLYGTLSDNRFTVMADFHDGEKPYAARLIVRDPQVAQNGLIGRATGSLSDTIPLGFGSGVRTFLASDSQETEAEIKPRVRANLIGVSASGDYVGDQGPVAVKRFDFPSRAWRAIAPLDPREDIVIAFDFRDGTQYARFEVGDFITGLGYVRMPSVYGKSL
ncbi:MULTISPECIES: hypothetical protein [Asticcacaulis]|uniref:hypothetical protein n=1 Tax=Asticcacaulis TaxID=76890 RepID=UPI001AE2442B|nr:MULTISPECIES: hypothetical protein [Asticcacaulis]MBP2158984.1 hypothetical protein [Asticcacaulis solisilvae]MDR6800029.1 hypothetical protein [Asticcacaulis sp. BE141]